MRDDVNGCMMGDKPGEWMRDGRMDVKIMNNNVTEAQRCEGHGGPGEWMRGDVKIMANQVNGYMTMRSS